MVELFFSLNFFNLLFSDDYDDHFMDGDVLASDYDEEIQSNDGEDKVFSHPESNEFEQHIQRLRGWQEFRRKEAEMNNNMEQYILRLPLPDDPNLSPITLGN
jgi:hypothetical protein